MQQTYAFQIATHIQQNICSHCLFTPRDKSFLSRTRTFRLIYEEKHEVYKNQIEKSYISLNCVDKGTCCTLYSS